MFNENLLDIELFGKVYTLEFNKPLCIKIAESYPIIIRWTKVDDRMGYIVNAAGENFSRLVYEHPELEILKQLDKVYRSLLKYTGKYPTSSTAKTIIYYRSLINDLCWKTDYKRFHIHCEFNIMEALRRVLPTRTNEELRALQTIDWDYNDEVHLFLDQEVDYILNQRHLRDDGFEDIEEDLFDGPMDSEDM